MKPPIFQKREDEQCSWPKCRQACEVAYRRGATIINEGIEVKLCGAHDRAFGELLSAAYAEKEGSPCVAS